MQTVGEILRAEREKKNLSVKDIENGTSIRALYITAIEEENYKIVPGEVYLKGFIRNYANYLGLDGKELVELYRQSQQSTVEQVPLEQRLKQERHKPRDPQEKSSWGKYVAAGVVIIAVVGAAAFMMPNNNSGQEKEKQPPVAQNKSTPVPAPAAPPQTPPNTTPAAVSSPVVIKAKFSEECWTLVTADGKEIYEGVPKPGESFTWEAKKNIVITVGNAGGIDLVYNGQPVGKLGAKGEVVEKTFSTKS